MGVWTLDAALSSAHDQSHLDLSLSCCDVHTSMSSPLSLSSSSSSSPTLRVPSFVLLSSPSVAPASRGHNLHAVVLSVGPVLERTKIDGTRVRLAEALIGDSSGTILFAARNDQIDLLVIGRTLTFRNAKIEMFKNRMRLAVDKWGIVETANGIAIDSETVNRKDNQLSEVEYELVDE